MSGELKAAKQARATARSWLTRACKSIETLLKTHDTDSVDCEDALAELNKRLNTVEECQAAVEVLIADPTQLDADLQEAGDYHDRAIKFRKDATRLYRSLAKVKAEDSDLASDNGAVKTAKLPKIELQTFSGDVTKFQEFWDQFHATVNSSDLPAVTKFTYLKSLLKNEAKATIEGLTLTEAHYIAACDILHERYGRKELVVFTHIQNLLNLKPDEKAKDSLSKLKSIMDQVNIEVRSLEALQIDGTTYGVTLTPIILSRLPNDVRIEWARQGKGKEGNLTFLLDFLRSEIDTRERADTFRITKPNSNEEQKKTPFKGKSAGSTASALHSQNEENTCVICGRDNHTTDQCYAVKKLDSLDEIKQLFVNAHACFKCAGRKHVAYNCQQKCEMCDQGHHKWLCPSRIKNGDRQKQNSGKRKIREESKKPAMVNQGTSTSSTCVAQGIYDRRGAVLQMIKVNVRGSQKQKKVNVMFDSGSDKTYVTKQLSKELNLKTVDYVHHRYAVFGGGKSSQTRRSIVNLQMMCENSRRFDVKALEVPVICQPIERPNISSEIYHRYGIPLDDEANGSVRIDLLVGMDYYWKLMTDEVEKIPDSNLVAQKSIFGYVLSGFVDGASSAKMSPQLLVLNDITESEVRRFWELEHIGIKPLGSKEENPLLKKFEETITYQEGRYAVELPWKEGKKEELMNNEVSARKRMWKQSYRLEKSPKIREEYNKVFQEWEKLGIIEEVPKEEEDVLEKPVFYMPHRPVVREHHSTTKVRPVFDASATAENGISLNDCLEVGPNLLPDLVEVLLRFRRNKIALNADIAKAFLQIALHEKERDVHRFLWYNGKDVRTMRFARVAFGVNCSPFLLNATIKYHLGKQQNSKVVQELRENLYMDDWLSGSSETSEAAEMYKEAKRIMAEAGMDLTKWNSNQKSILDKENELQEPVKVLGVKWSTEKDLFQFDGIQIPEDLTVTKRMVLSTLARIFDPLGFIAPVVMAGKILFQKLWELGLGWDEEIPEPLNQQFKRWAHSFEQLKTLQIPRRLTSLCWSLAKDNVKLHVYADSSELGYGAVAYLVTSHETTEESNLVISKARVAPLKKVTLPRLELLACLLATRLLTFVRNALLIPDVHYSCWSDSKVALGWIKGDPGRFKPFVANRVREIQNVTDPKNWLHIPGKENPADILTRGFESSHLIASATWWHGPPGEPCKTDMGKTTNQSSEEIDNPENQVVMASTNTTKAALFDTQRWGSFSKAVSIVRLVLDFIRKLKHKKSDVQQSYGHNLLNDHSEALHTLVRQEQRQSFHSEIKLMQQGHPVPKVSKLYSLNPFLDEKQMLRIKGRITEAQMSYAEKHPIVLDSCWLSTLIVRDRHIKMKHAGVDTVITSVRGEYWILGLRRLTKSIVKNCVNCQKVSKKKCDQDQSSLPKDRVTKSEPFEITGVDYAGPLYVSDEPGQKLYICLYTCAVIRAVHLELTRTLTTQEFVLCFRKFAARRNLPKVVYSDNAKTFRAAPGKLKEVYGIKAPKWKYIVPRAPWWGGFWERMVRNVKSALKKSLLNAIVTKAELEALLVEIESIVNSRPLTQVTDTLENQRPICPNDFLLVKDTSSYINEEPMNQRSNSLVDMYNERQKSLLKFWQIWANSYLKNLPKVVARFSENNRLTKGSMVLIQEDTVPRLQWPLGRVIELYPGKDNKVRSVLVQTQKGQFVRPIQRLCHLEGVTDGAEEQSELVIDKEVLDESVTTRSGRKSKPPQRLGMCVNSC